MSQPTVCCVMLVDGRPEMTRRAIASFEAQTYSNKSLHIQTVSRHDWLRGYSHRYDCVAGLVGRTIGAMRNSANARVKADFIAHFDSDDVSSPQRIAEQVALLDASGKACVGYREVLFWDTRDSRKCCNVTCHLAGMHVGNCKGDAWIYRNPDPRWVCGASMMYRREAWEACPLDDAPGEDQLWWLKNAAKCLGVSSLISTNVDSDECDLSEPRMICGIHGQNTEAYSRKDMLSGGGDVWFRAPEWDAYAERTMQL